MIKLHDMLLAGQAGVFTHDGEDFLMSCQKGSTVFFPVQIRLPATKIGWRGAIILLQLLLLYGTMKPDRQYEHGFYPYWRGEVNGQWHTIKATSSPASFPCTVRNPRV